MSSLSFLHIGMPLFFILLFSCCYCALFFSLQIFHVLEHKGDGGKSLLVDGFRAAQNVKDEDINSFQVLTETSIQSEYLEKGQHHSLTSPVLHLHPITGKFRQIRWITLP